MARFHSGVPVRHDSVTLIPHEHDQDPETAAAKCNTAIIHCILYTCNAHSENASYCLF